MQSVCLSACWAISRIPGKEDSSDAFPFSRYLPNPGIEPKSPTLQADSLLPEPPGKAKNTGVGSLSLVQENFATQESTQGFMHCSQIIYQLSYQGSPDLFIS